MIIHQFESTSVAKVAVTVTTSSDPTGAVPSFALTSTGTEPATFVDGEWDGTWNSTTGEVDALTPLLGTAQTLAVVADTDYQIWARWTVLTETPTERCAGILRVT